MRPAPPPAAGLRRAVAPPAAGCVLRVAGLVPVLLIAAGCTTRTPPPLACPRVASALPCPEGTAAAWPHPAGGTLLLCRDVPRGDLHVVETDGACRVRIEGRLRRGLRDGTFRFCDAAGTVRKEQVWSAGRATGTLRLYAEDGSPELEAHLVDGLLDGPWTRFHPSGSDAGGGPLPAETGAWREGRRHGTFRRFDREGRPVAEDTWRHGRLEGPWRRFHPDGRVAAMGERRAGETEGVVRRFDREGRLLEETGYRGGILHGVHRRFTGSGTLRLEENWRNGRLHGVRREWDDSGRLRREEHYREGERDGPTRILAPEGHVREEIHYRRGRRHGPYTLWHAPGRAARVGNYEDGRPIGVFTEQDPFGRVTGVREYRGPCSEGGRLVYEATPSTRAEWCQRTGDDGNPRKHGPFALYAPPDGAGDALPDEPGLVPEGWWTRWRERGPLLERAHYRDGALDGPFERFDPNGVKVAEGRYEMGRRTGLWTFRHPTGALAERGTWKNGRRHGHFVHAGETAAVIAEGEYREGRRVGRWRFRPSEGGPVRTVLYTPAGATGP